MPLAGISDFQVIFSLKQLKQKLGSSQHSILPLLAMASTTETPLRAELFGETPPVPDSPDINEVIQKLREELEQKYEEKIQELKVIIDALKGGPPNLNANPMNDVTAKFEKPEKLKPIDLKDLKKTRRI